MSHGWTSGGRSRTDTAEARAWREAVLDRCGRQCEIRGSRCAGRATQADHIVPVAEGGGEYDLDNGQGACDPCHAEKTHAEAARGRARLPKYRQRRAPEATPGWGPATKATPTPPPPTPGPSPT